jgi:DNA-binding response OmpR family regulator
MRGVACLSELLDRGRQGQGRVVRIPPLADVWAVPPAGDPLVIGDLVAHAPDDQIAVSGDDVIHKSEYRVTRGEDTPGGREYDASMRVLVVEDEPEVAGSLSRGLAEAGMAVDVALTGDEALDAIRGGLPYDVAVLDVMLGGDLDGMDICRYLRLQAAPTAVLMLTALDDVRDRLAGFDAGADDYLAKPFHFEEVLARVRALSRRGQVPFLQVLQAGNLSMDSSARQVMVAGDLVPTTRREYELLELFLRHPAQVLTKEQIHDAVWGDGQTIDSGLVEVYAGKIRRKLHSARASVALETCRGVGYRLVSGEGAGA